MQKQELSVHEKRVELSKLSYGDIVKINNNETASFVCLKRKNFEGIINGVPYNIPVEAYEGLISKSEVTNSYKDLQPGEAFIVNDKGNALFFKFIEFENGKIIAMNPISKIRTKIGISLYAGKIGDF